jgi:branched-chain amino acid transport system ATP-binding protein
MTVTSAMLQLEGVNTWRGPAQVLRGVSLRVGDGECVSLVGRNGAGKTTTIDSIMGLLPTRAGAIALRGRDITREPAHARAKLGIGYAPEDCGIFPDLTVAENFEITTWLTRGGARSGATRAADQDRVFAVFPEVRTFLGRRGLYLSGGQKKMVAITRAMALAPSILLLDEPFEGLAPVVVTRFIEAVRTIKAMGVSLLIAESNVTSAARVCDRLYAIDRGEIIFDGQPADALTDPEVMKTIRG